MYECARRIPARRPLFQPIPCLAPTPRKHAGTPSRNSPPPFQQMLWALLRWEEGDILFTFSWNETDHLLVNTDWEILVFWKETGWSLDFLPKPSWREFPSWKRESCQLWLASQMPRNGYFQPRSLCLRLIFSSSPTWGKPTYDLLESKKINFPDWVVFWWPGAQETHEFPRKLPCTHLNSLRAGAEVCLQRGWGIQPFTENQDICSFVFLFILVTTLWGTIVFSFYRCSYRL